MSNKKKFILPVIAVILVLIAAAVTLFMGDDTESVSDPNAVTAGTDYVLAAEDLSKDEVTFIKPVKDSNIELLARIGEDGKAKVALGTCQSCNGAPGAYYSQVDDVLQCNNCGLTFELDVVDSPGGGCHPIMLDESVYAVSDAGMTIDTEKLQQYEELFAQVDAH